VTLHTAREGTSAQPAATPGPQRLVAAVQMARPYSLLWFVTVPTATMAVWLGHGQVRVGELARLIVAFACTDAGLTTWNDVCDLDTDRYSSEGQRNRRPLAAGSISLRWARRQVLVLVACGLAAAFALSWSFGLLLACGALFGLGYSAKPVYMGGRPLVSQAFWVVLWPAMYAGVALALDEGPLSSGWLYVAGTVSFMGIGETLAKDLRDLENDSRAGKRTTPVAFGTASTTPLSLVALLLGAVLWVMAGALASPSNGRLTAALGVVLALWIGRAAVLTVELSRGYAKQLARDMHVGSIRVFLTVNLLFLAGLYR
jgi:4-hydroxybenzoate polyprenyltransferase